MSLSSSMTAVNTWLTSVAADASYSTLTGYEYAKVCRYTLEWLALHPVRLGTGMPVSHSLLAFHPQDTRALDAWMNLRAAAAKERVSLARTGILPVRYRTLCVLPATRRFRRAVLTTFLGWLLVEYEPPDGALLTFTTNPYHRRGRSQTPWQVHQRPDGFLPAASLHLPPLPATTLRQGGDTDEPIILTASEWQTVRDTIPVVSCGTNAAHRNGAIIRFLFWGMLRQSEVIGATWETIEDTTLRVVGKGGKKRHVPIVDPETWAFLHAYTTALRIPLRDHFHGALFRQLDHEDRAITANTLEHLIHALKAAFRRQAAREIRPERQHYFRQLAAKLHSHIFRATGATYMAAHGLDLLRLARLLGHANPATTQRYYIAGSYLDMTTDVARVYAQVVPHLTDEALLAHPHDPDGWYHRRGWQRTNGDPHGQSAGE